MSSHENAHIADCSVSTFASRLCAAYPEICSDGADNDGDTLVDCADPDCKVWVATPTASLGAKECSGSPQVSEYCSGATNVNCPDPLTCECYDSLNAELRYCADGDVGEWAYRHDMTGDCADRGTYPRCTDCDTDASSLECGATFTDDTPGYCLDWENVVCDPTQDMVYDSTSVPKTNPNSICCPANQYAYYDSDFDSYDCRDTAPCYDPNDPTALACHFDYANPGEFNSWITSSTNNPEDFDPSNLWCVAPAPTSGAAAQACCPEVKFGIFEYYSSEEDNVVIY